MKFSMRYSMGLKDGEILCSYKTDSDLIKLINEYETLKAENEKFRKALEFYENCSRLTLQVRDINQDSFLGSAITEQHIMDNGDTARIALKKHTDFKKGE